MSVETIARRYAGALADVVTTTNETETVKGELKVWEQMITGNSELNSAFANPSIQHSDKVKVLESLLQRSAPSKTTANFLRVLLRNSRLTDLAAINERFDVELEERSGIASVQVISARELGENERAELKTNLEKLTGKQVKLDFDIDQAIIGGIVTRVGSTVYDGSVKTQLENLKEQLVNG
ncbi:MAG TPA: ATP synthase F1 subunit delta [Pyrinomonadaceae bacterium]|nr:ATP synthase F1 subunit delta [Pyrinomonadaceae bacterium]